MPILFTSAVYRTNVYWSVIHGIKRKPHLSVLWNWYHFVAIAILHQPRPTDSADINTRLQLNDTSSIPPMHGGFLLRYRADTILSTDGQTDKVIPVYPPFNFVEAGGITILCSIHCLVYQTWCPGYNILTCSNSQKHCISCFCRQAEQGVYLGYFGDNWWFYNI